LRVDPSSGFGRSACSASRFTSGAVTAAPAAGRAAPLALDAAVGGAAGRGHTR
jgi:hypothetical protein